MSAMRLITEAWAAGSAYRRRRTAVPAGIEIADLCRDLAESYTRSMPESVQEGIVRRLTHALDAACGPDGMPPRHLRVLHEAAAAAVRGYHEDRREWAWLRAQRSAP